MNDHVSTARMAAYVRENLHAKGPVDASTELERDLGAFGDEVHSFMEDYFDAFEVDPKGYLWYFHTGEEGISPGSLVFKAPQERVEQIPLTVGMLRDAANAGRWLVEYPEHDYPKRRYDLWLNAGCSVVGIVALVLWWWLVA